MSGIKCTMKHRFKCKKMDKYKHLIGREFKRNKYGLSDWTQRVTRVIEIGGVIKIYGDGKSLYPYRIDEIKFIFENETNQRI